SSPSPSPGLPFPCREVVGGGLRRTPPSRSCRGEAPTIVVAPLPSGSYRGEAPTVVAAPPSSPRPRRRCFFLPYSAPAALEREAVGPPPPPTISAPLLIHQLEVSIMEANTTLNAIESEASLNATDVETSSSLSHPRK
ncbi:hypothetical protein Taro_018378, partial [Colocasia esculenta]|nr:hypothetical protein [Colocasia esculenta]